VRANLAEAAGDQDDRFDAALAAGFDRGEHGRRRHDEDRQVKRVGRGGQAGVAAQTQDLIGLRIDRVNGAGETMRACRQVADHRVAELGRVAAGAHHRHPTGAKEGQEVLDGRRE